MTTHAPIAEGVHPSSEVPLKIETRPGSLKPYTLLPPPPEDPPPLELLLDELPPSSPPPPVAPPSSPPELLELLPPELLPLELLEVPPDDPLDVLLELPELPPVELPEPLDEPPEPPFSDGLEGAPSEHATSAHRPERAETATNGFPLMRIPLMKGAAKQHRDRARNWPFALVYSREDTVFR
jgi:hypothetical protein